jgi:hypothetical protein
MTDTWGRLDDDSREAIRARVDQLRDDEVASRIPRTDGEVRFRLFGGLATAEADIALSGEEFAIGPPPPREVVLIAPEDFDYDVEATDQDAEMAASVDENLEPLREYYATDPRRAGRPVGRRARPEAAPGSWTTGLAGPRSRTRAIGAPASRTPRSRC